MPVYRDTYYEMETDNTYYRWRIGMYGVHVAVSRVVKDQMTEQKLSTYLREYVARAILQAFAPYRKRRLPG